MVFTGSENIEIKKMKSPSERPELAAEIVPDMDKLRLYTKAKLALADQLRIMRETLKAFGRENGERECGDLVVKLAEDRFTLAVLGQFKRGKSSLMNAIIGRDLLPTGILPLTSAITILKYGPVERLVVRRLNSIFPEELPISALADYVTEIGNPGNQKKVKTACVELPVPFLRRGIEFVDTPGVGSAITANTETTYDFLPECDAVLFVTSVDTPMTSLELSFLKDIRKYVDKIFFVVNKTDLLDDDERSEVLKFVIATIQSQIGRDSVKVFPVSARLGLAARTTGDSTLYEQSGIKALEEALVSFLSEEKSAAFLAAVMHRALKILDDDAAQRALLGAPFQNRGGALWNEELPAVRRDPHATRAALKEARAKIDILRAGILKGRMAEVAETEVPQPIAVSAGAPAGTVEASADVEADLQTRGCPVCRHISKSAMEFFAHWQYRIGTEEEAQAQFAAELGFCPLHTWQLLAVSSPHGASTGFARLAEQTARRLRENADMTTTGDAVRQLMRDSRSCRVCGLLSRIEGEYIRQLAVMMNRAAGQRQYARSQGVCLRHLGMLMNAVSVSGTCEFLLAHAAERFEEDAEDMRSFAMKQDALRRALQNRSEADAYQRAVTRMVGGKSVCTPWEEDGEI